MRFSTCLLFVILSLFFNIIGDTRNLCFPLAECFKPFRKNFPVTKQLPFIRNAELRLISAIKSEEDCLDDIRFLVVIPK